MSASTATEQQQAGRRARRINGGGTQVTDLDGPLYQALRRASFEEHKPMTQIVREALIAYPVISRYLR